MADLNDDRKKEEEEYGGFEPDENDDESFMLEDENDYPAKLPDEFSDEPSSTVRVTASVESLDSDSEQEEELESQIEETEEKPQVEEIEIEKEQEDVEQEIIPEVGSEPEEDEELDLDEEFKKKLQEDIDKSKAKREASSEQIEDNSHSEPAKQIGDDADTVVILTDIDADKPSNVKVAEEVTTPPIEEATNEEPQNEVVEEKKKKKTPIWILMLYSSVATLIVTLGAVALLWYFMSDGTDEHGTDEPKQEKIVDNHENHNIEHNKKAETSEAMTQEEKNWLDSMDIDKKDTLLTYKEDKEFFAGLEDDFEDEGFQNEKPKSNTNSPKKVEPKVNVPKKELIEKKKENIASNDNTNKVVPKQKQKTSIVIDESNFSMPQPKGPAPEKGLFMVQIYSSPSREDAESWLGQLKARQVPNAMITEQEVKGRTWYRVRYGKFETKEAARTSALELGYSQSWIDRVK